MKLEMSNIIIPDEIIQDKIYLIRNIKNENKKNEKISTIIIVIG